MVPLPVLVPAPDQGNEDPFIDPAAAAAAEEEGGNETAAAEGRSCYLGGAVQLKSS
jgi:hypothetical protein